MRTSIQTSSKERPGSSALSFGCLGLVLVTLAVPEFRRHDQRMKLQQVELNLARIRAAKEEWARAPKNHDQDWVTRDDLARHYLDWPLPSEDGRPYDTGGSIRSEPTFDGKEISWWKSRCQGKYEGCPL